MYTVLFTFDNDEVRYDVYKNGDQICYVKRHKHDFCSEEPDADDVITPFQEYPTLGDSLRALGWRGQALEWTSDDDSIETQEALVMGGTQGNPDVWFLHQDEHREHHEHNETPEVCID